MLLEAGAHYGLSEAVSKGDVNTVSEIIRVNPAAATELLQPPEALLRQITFGRFEGETPERVEIFKLLMDSGWQVSKKSLLREAQGCANSNRPLLAAAFRDYAATAPDEVPKKRSKKPKTDKQKGKPAKKAKKDSKESIENLCKAAEEGDVELCRKYLGSNPELVHETFEGMEPIHFATQNNRVDVLKYLLEQGADLNAIGGEDGRTPLHFAAEGLPKAAQFLIEKGADLNAVDMLGYTPLALAISEQSPESGEVVEMLRRAGASYGLTEAAAMGDLQQVKKIFSADPGALAKAPSKELLLTLLIYVGNYGTLPDREEILRLLFDHGWKISAEQLLDTARRCEISNIGNFGKLLRHYAARETA